MPLPHMNVVNGGKHANWATDFQEYMILPIGAKTVIDAIRMGSEVYQSLQTVLCDKNYAITVGDEGGFAPAVASNSEPFALLSEAVTRAGYHAGDDVVFGIDSAASEFYTDTAYSLKREGKTCSTDELIAFYEEMLSTYPIVTMEDIFSQDDWEGFRKFTEKHGTSIQIVGDDLYATNVRLLERGITEKSTNAILIKVNQIGTITETIHAILLARKNHMNSIVSHRSGETEDTFIADFVVAMGTGQIKTGSLARSERVAKYNRLITIADMLGEKAVFTVPVFGN
jgi:enolase